MDKIDRIAILDPKILKRLRFLKTQYKSKKDPNKNATYTEVISKLFERNKALGDKVKKLEKENAVMQEFIDFKNQ